MKTLDKLTIGWDLASGSDYSAVTFLRGKKIIACIIDDETAEVVIEALSSKDDKIKQQQQQIADYKEALEEVVKQESMNCSCSSFAKQALSKWSTTDE